MKILFVAFATIMALVFQDTCLGGATNNFADTVLQAQTSGNTKQMISALTNADALWSSHPEQYFESMQSAAVILGGNSPKDPAAKEALVLIFTNVLLKPFPTDVFPNDNNLAAKCIELQVRTAWICSDEMKWANETNYSLILARYIGEIRSHIIPHYKRKGGLLNGPDFTAQDRAQNDEYLNEDHLQNMLHPESNSLTFLLMHSNLNLNSNLVNQITEAAHLTAQERSAL